MHFPSLISKSFLFLSVLSSASAAAVTSASTLSRRNPTEKRPHLYLSINRGEPLDYMKYRHVALWAQFSNAADSVKVHVTGAPGFFEFAAEKETRPTHTHPKHEQTIDLGVAKKDITREQLIAVCKKVHINNSKGADFNCQTCIGDVLKELAKDGIITKKEADDAEEKMVDAIMEAKHEP